MRPHRFIAVIGSMIVGLSVLAMPPAVAQDVDGRYREFGDPGGFWNLVPPGQTGHIPPSQAPQAASGGQTPEHFEDQLPLYENIVFQDATPGFGADDLPRYFKDASFGVPPDDIGPTYRPGGRDDVVVIREKDFGVPHVFGDTREGTMFGAGYTGAEDRLFLMDVLRHVGRAELAAFLGPSDGNKSQDASQMAAAPYTENDLQQQVEDLRTSEDPTLRQVFLDGSHYVDGVNQYIQDIATDPSKLPAEYVALNRVPEEFIPEDIVAIASLVGGIFGKGGGGEVRNWCGLQEMTADLGDQAAARRVFDDLKFPDDVEAPRTAHSGSWPYMNDLGPVDPASIPDLDCSSLRPLEAPPPDQPEDFEGLVEEIVPEPPLPGPSASRASLDLPWGSVPFDLDLAMSNALLVAGDRTDTGNPLAVFGPQTGYFVPQLLVEKALYGPGIAARGVSFAGTDIYIQLGRGDDYAFSATSAGADLVDEFVLELCEPGGGEPTTDSMGYRHDGACKPIEAHQEVLVARPSAAGLPVGTDDPSPEELEQDDVLLNKYFERTEDYGPVIARGTTTDGTPIAVAESRTTYGEELKSARGFKQINDPAFMAEGADSFRRAFGIGVDYTFNWFYVDGDDIAYQVSCKCPQRAQGTDPYLPTWGTGEYDWQGLLARPGRLPFSVNPEEGYLVSWNNKQALDFWSNDRQFGWGPIHRSSLLERRLRSVMDRGPVEVGAAVDVMALAATTDLRAQELVAVLRQVMEGRAPADTPDRVRNMFARLAVWSEDDLGHRRDHDDDGDYERPVAVAIMDAWWGGYDGHPDAKLFDAVFAPETTGGARAALGLDPHNEPQSHLGSAFQDSLYAHVHKDLRQVLGRDVRDPLSRTYCGGGDLQTCATALWESLDEAAGALTEEFGSSSVDDWRRLPADDEVRHSAISVASVPPIHWENRPTFQQVVQVPVAEAPGPQPGPVAPAPAEPPATPSTGDGIAGVILGLALLAGAGALRTRGRPGQERDST